MQRPHDNYLSLQADVLCWSQAFAGAMMEIDYWKLTLEEAAKGYGWNGLMSLGCPSGGTPEQGFDHRHLKVPCEKFGNPLGTCEKAAGVWEKQRQAPTEGKVDERSDPGEVDCPSSSSPRTGEG
eukprot:8217520-Prorocentrum_lima.AAC.1